MINLLYETENILKEHNKTLEDIVWIGNEDYYVDIEKFKDIANTEYFNGYGFEEVATDLIIVGNNWWLERHVYDGSEWWEYKTLPVKPNKKMNLKVLTTRQAKKVGYDSYGHELRDINNIEKM